MDYLPFSTGDGTTDLVACFILRMPRLDWFKQNVLAALAEMTTEANWTPLGTVSAEQAAEYAEIMIQGVIVKNFDPLPVGRIEAYAGIVIPEGWLLCHGQALDTADYHELFMVIGYTFGGAGSSFNLPDLRNRAGVGSGDIYALAATGGLANVTLMTAEMPSHNHIASGTTAIDLGHAHSEGNALPNITTIGVGAPEPTAVPGIGITGAASANIQVTDPTISGAGGDGAHENMPPFVALNFIIYAGI